MSPTSNQLALCLATARKQHENPLVDNGLLPGRGLRSVRQLAQDFNGKLHSLSGGSTSGQSEQRDSCTFLHVPSEHGVTSRFRADLESREVVHLASNTAVHVLESGEWIQRSTTPQPFFDLETYLESGFAVDRSDPFCVQCSKPSRYRESNPQFRGDLVWEVRFWGCDRCGMYIDVPCVSTRCSGDGFYFFLARSVSTLHVRADPRTRPVFANLDMSRVPNTLRFAVPVRQSAISFDSIHTRASTARRPRGGSIHGYACGSITLSTYFSIYSSDRDQALYVFGIASASAVDTCSRLLWFLFLAVGLLQHL